MDYGVAGLRYLRGFLAVTLTFKDWSSRGGINAYDYEPMISGHMERSFSWNQIPKT